MTSTTGSTQQLGSSPAAVKRAAVITHGKAETIGPALQRLEELAADAGVELFLDEAEAAKHDVEAKESELEQPISRSCSAATGRCCARSPATTARTSRCSA